MKRKIYPSSLIFSSRWLIKSCLIRSLDLELIIVEDNSKDKTREVAEKIVKFYKGKVKLLKRPKKMGLGSAYVDGFEKT